MKTNNKFGLSALVLSSVLGATAFAQSGQSSAPASASTQATESTSASTKAAASPADSSTYATGKPLETQSKEGFWGHMNPLARKKWVHRQVDPIKDRANELDQLQAKNANDIKDVDSRAQAGINKAMLAANTADQHARTPTIAPTPPIRWQTRPALALALSIPPSAIWTSISLSPRRPSHSPQAVQLLAPLARLSSTT